MPPRNTPGSTKTRKTGSGRSSRTTTAAAAKGGELPKMKAEAAERRKAAPLHRKHPHKGKGEGKAEGK